MEHVTQWEQHVIARQEAHLDGSLFSFIDIVGLDAADGWKCLHQEAPHANLDTIKTSSIAMVMTNIVCKLTSQVDADSKTIAIRRPLSSVLPCMMTCNL